MNHGIYNLHLLLCKSQYIFKKEDVLSNTQADAKAFYVLDTNIVFYIYDSFTRLAIHDYGRRSGHVRLSDIWEKLPDGLKYELSFHLDVF